jgi:hypothetical protein
MKTRSLSCAVSASLLIAVSGCSNLSPGENAAIFGGLAGAATGIPLGASGVNPAVTIPVAAGSAVVVGAAAYVISKHQADREQRRIAEERARAYVARMEAEQKAAEAAAQSRAARTASAPRRTAPQPVPQYIAVETTPSPEAQGKSSVMVYDTQRRSLVGNDVYDLKKAPKQGSVAQLDTRQAVFVGEGV